MFWNVNSDMFLFIYISCSDEVQENSCRVTMMLRYVVGLTLSFVRVTCVELDLIECGIDHEAEVAQGEVALTQYPWIGILYYIFYGEIGETRAVTTVMLVQKEFVIANAADIGPMPKHDFRKKSRVLLGESWSGLGRRVRNYVLHPEYGQTYNTLALVQLRDLVRDLNIKPLCPTPEVLRNPVFYVMKFKDNFTELHKEVVPVAHVPSGMCKDFYTTANLYTYKMRPPHVVCAVALDTEAPCVWEAGAALVARDVWGRWQLLGVGARGPGCGAPARFLDMASYGAWLQYSLQRFQRITITKLNKHKYVLRSGGEETAEEDTGSTVASYQRFGACDPEEKLNCIYREYIKLETDNRQYQFLTYNLSIRANVEYTCLTMEMVNASATSEMRILHHCPRENFAEPCYYYKGSVFMVSVLMMFSEACSFEMYAWGFPKEMKLLDIQEWKWEEGSYYEDFSTARTEYRGPKYMTDFGYEPVDQKMWVPDYDLWTTSHFDPDFWSTTTEIPNLYGDEEKNRYPVTEFLPSTTTTVSPPSTTPTTTAYVPRTKKKFRKKTTLPPLEYETTKE